MRFAAGERMPKFDPAAAPRLDSAGWPEERLRKVERSYSMEYVRSLLPTMQELFGPEEAAALVGRTARLIGLQFFEETFATTGAASFIEYLATMQRAQGENVTVEGNTVTQQGWRLMDGVALTDAGSAFRAWNALWEGALAAHDRDLTLRTAGSEAGITWTVLS